MFLCKKRELCKAQSSLYFVDKLFVVVACFNLFFHPQTVLMGGGALKRFEKGNKVREGRNVANFRDLFQGIIGVFQIPFDDFHNQFFSILRGGAAEKLFILFAKIRLAIPKQTARFLGGVFDRVVHHQVFDIEKGDKLRVFHVHVVCREGVRFVQKVENLFDKAWDIFHFIPCVRGVYDIRQPIHRTQNVFRINGAISSISVSLPASIERQA